MSKARDKVRERIAKYQMELYCESKGWEADDWDDLPEEVHQKYFNEADKILSMPGIAITEKSNLPIHLTWEERNPSIGFNRKPNKVRNKLKTPLKGYITTKESIKKLESRRIENDGTKDIEGKRT